MVGNIETIVYDGDLIGLVVKGQSLPDKTNFITPPELPLQLGYIVYPKDGQIARHYHNPDKREIHQSSEVLIIKKGKCIVDFYSSDQVHVSSYELTAGDIIVIYQGGHSFKMLEDTVMLEIKQGPFFENEKRFF